MPAPAPPSAPTAAKQPHWFILCGARMWEEQARQLLADRGFRAFVPLRPASRMSKTGKVVLRPQPLLAGWVFVYATWQELEDFKQFVQHRHGKKDDLRFFTPEEVKLKAGDRVRVIGGPFNGQEGYFLKTAGKRSKSLVIELPGCLLAATTTVLPELVQVIERRKD